MAMTAILAIRQGTIEGVIDRAAGEGGRIYSLYCRLIQGKARAAVRSHRASQNGISARLFRNRFQEAVND